MLAAQSAVVSIDGAMVYKGASFDAPVIAYLKKGKKIRISSRTYGPFYKVKVRSGLVGYISDIDVKVMGKAAKKSRSRGNEKERDRDVPDFEKRRKPIFATTYLGVHGGIANYKEEFTLNVNGNDSNQVVSANVPVYGVKLTGPNILIQGPFVFDINAYFSFGAPSYYDQISQTAPTGLLAFIDFKLVFPMLNETGDDWMVYLGAGPSIVYSKFEFTANDLPIENSEISLGGSFMLGFAYRIGKFIIKLEPHYYVEKKSYAGGIAAVQMEL